MPDDRHVQQVLDLCIRIGEVLLSSGEGSGAAVFTAVIEVTGRGCSPEWSSDSRSRSAQA